MSNAGSEIRHVSDTALMVAGCRAVESEAPDAFFNDPFAARLAGERGMAMFHALPHRFMMRFGIAIRTRFLDELLGELLASTHLSTVVSVGAGLDTRPWRLELPADLRWIEVDFPDMLDYKESLMASEKPRCRRERLSADLNNPDKRRAMYQTVGSEPALMITEGLLMYLPAATVESLAAEPSRESGIAHWISDITTSTFSQALGGYTSRVVGHVQAEDHLEGEQILKIIDREGWVPVAHRSYITDLAFATERIQKMMAGQPEPPTQPSWSKDEPAGVHRFARR
jgi:methyltransferase (TIGR00027 family)